MSQERSSGPSSGGYPGGRAAAALGAQPVRADAALRSSSQPSGYAAGSAARERESQARRRAVPAEVEQMVNTLDQRVAHATQSEESKLRMLADQMQRLMEGLHP